MKLADAVKKETLFMACGCLVGAGVLIAAFGGLHLAFPAVVPFDYTVVLASVLGAAVGIINFFWTALSVQKVAAEEDADRAKKQLQLGYTRRMTFRMGYGLLSIVLPFLNAPAAILSLFIPSFVLKVRAIPAVAARVEGEETGAEEVSAAVSHETNPEDPEGTGVPEFIGKEAESGEGGEPLKWN